MKKIFLILVVLIFLLALVLITNKNSNSGHIYSEPSIIINDKIIKVEIADDVSEQAQGLSDRPSLNADTGMLFVFPVMQQQGFWMKNMNFPIDIIWIADNKIVKIDKNLPPEKDQPKITYSSLVPVNYVLEINAGWSETNNIKVGDTIKINF